jgi:aminoglycoside phosphotransferase (APT) family kinase protein
VVTAEDEAAALALGRALGGEVRDLRRLSGGASRVTSSFELVGVDGALRRLILQQNRGKGMVGPGRVRVEVALLAAAAGAGVPAPRVVAHGDEAEFGTSHGWLVVERIEGETIPRKILRDPEWATARSALTAQCGQALAAIHSIDPDRIAGLEVGDPLHDPPALLDAMGEVRPALEFGARWLATHPCPAGPRVTVHGDFRLGNLMVGPDGLRAVLDWELAHAGDPAEDVAWLCAPAWRFGGVGEVGGFGAVAELLEAYRAAGGAVIEPERLRWWMVYATVKWATICALQASAHLDGTTRSVELAAIGRRVCESEWDLFVLLGVAPTVPAVDGAGAPAVQSAVVAPFGRPTAVELVEAVREYVEQLATDGSDAGARFGARVARNVLSTVARELTLGPSLAAAHRDRVQELGYDSDSALAIAIRSGACAGQWAAVGAALAASARDQLLVANPAYLPAANA